MLLLPIQFSRCLKITSAETGAGEALPRLVRANLVQTAVLFDRSLNAEIHFSFGPGRDTHCRAMDALDYEGLDFQRWSH